VALVVCIVVPAVKLMQLVCAALIQISTGSTVHTTVIILNQVTGFHGINCSNSISDGGIDVVAINGLLNVVVIDGPHVTV
jgi:hypothetical protein